MRNAAIVALALIAACGAPAPAPNAETLVRRAPLMGWDDLLSRPMPAATTTIRFAPGYGGEADLWLPRGAGPYPVVVMIHGGCWHTSVANRTIMSFAADALRQQGIAVWNIEYRGVDDPGGGYPGTFEDTARAADALREIAPRYHLDLNRVVAFGHSAGGHLAAWLAARHKLPRGSALYAANPLPLRAVVLTGGLPDLRTAAEGCSARSIGLLTGASSAARVDVFADTSPADLLPFGIPQTVFNGDQDTVAPPAMGAAYVIRARASGDSIEQIVLVDAGHVEEIAPGTPAFDREVATLGGILAVP